jgi:hypothetical protein
VVFYYGNIKWAKITSLHAHIHSHLCTSKYTHTHTHTHTHTKVETHFGLITAMIFPNSHGPEVSLLPSFSALSPQKKKKKKNKKNRKPILVAETRSLVT